MIKYYTGLLHFGSLAGVQTAGHNITSFAEVCFKLGFGDKVWNIRDFDDSELFSISELSRIMWVEQQVRKLSMCTFTTGIPGFSRLKMYHKTFGFARTSHFCMAGVRLVGFQKKVINSIDQCLIGGEFFKGLSGRIW